MKLWKKNALSNIDLTEKVCIVTGATGSLGFNTCLWLASMGATVIMAVHDMDKGNQAKEDIIQKTGNANVEAMFIDLANLNSVKSFAKKFLNTGLPLHILINNAAILASPYKLTADKLEEQFQVNYLSHFLLTQLLLDRMIESAPAKILNVSALFHILGKANIMGQTKSSFKNFCDSKSALVQFSYILADYLKGTGVTVNVVDPAFAKSTAFHQTKGFLLKLLLLINQKFLGRNPVSASQDFAYLASAPELENVSGRYFLGCCDITKYVQKPNPQLASKLWKMSEDIIVNRAKRF